MKLLLRILIVLGVVAILVVGGGAGYVTYTVRRPLPQTSGTLTLPGLDGKVEIYRDASGIPQIYASTTHDLFFAQGVVHAQDRWWQMEFNRHIGMGRIGELTGYNETVLGQDKFIRTLGWARSAAADVASMTPDSLKIMTDYTSGVNAYLDGKSGSDLAVEYSILALNGVKIPLEKWEPVHSVVWAKVMAWDLAGNWGDELERAALYNKVGKEATDAYFDPPYQYGSMPTILTAKDWIAPTAGTSQAALVADKQTDAQADFSHIQTQVIGNVDGRFAPIFGHATGIGSNNWVIAGSRTTTGKPLLANDPHLGIRMPSIWYRIGLHCTAVNEQCPYDVDGYSFAGAPGVIIGHNAKIAWGVTNVGPDTQDLYIIKVDPKDDTKYQVDGKTETMQVITETIKFGDNKPSVDLKVRVTRYGPIITEVSDSAKEYGQPLAFHWTAIFEKYNVLSNFIRIDKAQNWEDFRAALSDFVSPAQNFIYADVNGNIGYQMPGFNPIRAAGHTGKVPVDGSTTKYDWKGYVPFEDLPHAYNPPKGYIATANNPVVPPEYYDLLSGKLGDKFGKDTNYTFTYDWDFGYRARRINELINKTDKLSVDSIKTIQGDGYEGFAADVMPGVLKLDFGSDVPKDVVDWMKAWDFQMDKDSGQAALFAAFYGQLTTTLWQNRIGYVPDGTNIRTGIRLLMDQPDNPLWSSANSADVKGNRDTVLRSAFVTAYKTLGAKLGADYKAWKWGTLHTSVFVSNPLGASGIDALEQFVNGGPVATSGSLGVINATSWSAAEPYGTAALPSMRMIVDLSNFDASQWIDTTGQSGHPASPHYRDMIEKWRNIQYETMSWDAAKIKSGAAELLTLQPR